MDAETLARESIREWLAVREDLEQLVPEIASAAKLLAKAYLRGGKAIFFGNGGSAADAQHFAAELVGRFRAERRPLPAIALHANTSTLTAIGNDYGYDEVFARQLRAFAKPGDVAVAISTSGSSSNVVEAVRLNNALQIEVISLTGANSDGLKPFSDVVIAVPSRNTPRVQEAHALIGHVLCEWVEMEVVAAAHA